MFHPSMYIASLYLNINVIVDIVLEIASYCVVPCGVYATMLKALLLLHVDLPARTVTLLLHVGCSNLIILQCVGFRHALRKWRIISFFSYSPQNVGKVAPSCQLAPGFLLQRVVTVVILIPSYICFCRFDSHMFYLFNTYLVAQPNCILRSAS